MYKAIILAIIIIFYNIFQMRNVTYSELSRPRHFIHFTSRSADTRRTHGFLLSFIIVIRNDERMSF